MSFPFPDMKKGLNSRRIGWVEYKASGLEWSFPSFQKFQPTSKILLVLIIILSVASLQMKNACYSLMSYFMKETDCFLLVMIGISSPCSMVRKQNNLADGYYVCVVSRNSDLCFWHLIILPWSKIIILSAII